MAKRLTSEERKELCRIKWNGKYDYSKSDFTLVKTKTDVICPIHGVFQIDYDHHFNGNIGCKFCSYPSRDLESFVKTANEIYNGFYSYENAVYVDAHTNLLITCPIHGDFQKCPNAHLRGQGCPECSKGKISLEEKVENALIDENIEYVRGYKPSWLKDKPRSQLSLDFFITNANLVVECQGKQHFGQGGWTENYDFEDQYERDKRKNSLCKANNVDIVYFANKSEAPTEYFGEIFTSVDELMKRIKYLYKKCE